MHAHCLVPMHTLLLPIARNSILLQRPNHQILFPGNFYPFMSLRSVSVCMRAMLDESNEIVAQGEEGDKKRKRIPVFLRSIRFRLFSPVS